ncbi:pyridoxamine 5'-phosphate oxidase family protein [Spirochaetia bacterium 38H-sp]|uniref:Pyridoxamine 5'-phosphate oxidase family protein n=1 Tax=Rarispira pelagica TaxID=3141764 RepID=A0ABU9UEN2_9SPIR
MTKDEVLAILEELVESNRSGVFVSVGEDGFPDARWMTAAFLRGEHRDIYAVTSPSDKKVTQVSANPNVLWLLERKGHREVFRVKARATVVENPALLSQVLETLGGSLNLFWQVHGSVDEFAVLECNITSVEYQRPLDAYTEVFSWE